MARVFLSYSRNDGKVFVAEVDAALRNRGFEVWRDMRDLRPDQDFTADIEDAIENSSYIVVCVTEDSKRKNSFVRREIQYALAMKRPVIPLRCEDIVPHVSVVNNEWVNYFADKANAIIRLVEIFDGAGYENKTGDQPEDQFKPYLERALKSIVNGLKQRIIRQIDLKAMATPDAVNATTAAAEERDIFDQFFSGVTIGDTTDEDQTRFESFAEAFAHYNGRVLLLGEPGAGKTITLMAHARDAIIARLDDPTQPLPLLGLIPTWDADKQPPLHQWLAETYQLASNILQQVMEQGQALLLLDGLDELGRERPVDPKDPDSETYDPRLRFAQVLPESNQILMTSRIEDYNDMVEHGEKATLSGAITLQALDDSQIAHYLAEQPELLSLIRSDEQLRDIVQTPLLMSFFAFAYQGMSDDERALLTQLDDARDLRDRIFMAYIEQRYKHEEMKANADLPFSIEALLDSLGKLATNHLIYGYDINMISVNDMKNDILDENQLDYFIDLTSQLSIIIPSGTRFSFIHIFLLETLAFTYSMVLLKEKNHRSVDISARVLKKLRDTRAVEPLIHALDYDDRGEVVLALGELRDKQAIAPLINQLDSYTYRDSLGNVIVALGQLGAREAVDRIIARLNEQVGHFGQAAFQLHAVIALGEIGDESAVGPLITKLNHSNRDFQEYVVKALGMIGDTRATEPLVDLLSEKNWHICKAAAYALGQIGDVRAIQPLIEVLNNQRGFYHRSALVGLIQFDNIRAIKPLIMATEHEDDYTREKVNEILGESGELIITHIMDMLKDEDATVRYSAARVLRNFEDFRAVNPLIMLLSDEDRRVQISALLALSSIGTPEALAAVEQWRREQKQ